jgi:hypothetical protein
MHISDTHSPYDCLTSLSQHSLAGTLKNLRQDVFLTEGEDDHLFPVDRMYQIMRLVCARSVTASMFTAPEGGEHHCQVGNSALAREEIVRSLARFHQWNEYSGSLTIGKCCGMRNPTIAAIIHKPTDSGKWSLCARAAKHFSADTITVF